MSQKINPQSIRIGVNQSWFIKTQKYGNNFKAFINFFYNYKKSWKFIFKLFESKSLFLNQINFWHQNSKFFIVLHVKNCEENEIGLLSRFFYWSYFKNFVTFRLYNVNEIKNTNILFLYTQYLSLKLNYPAKKILAIMTSLLKKQLYSKTIVFCTKGPTKLVFKGFKIKLKGRLENQKNQMATSLTVKEGFLTLTSFNNYTSFKNINLNTKLGLCNFKLWLFYKII